MSQELWQKYKESPTQDIRNQLLLHYIPYVETIARQVERTVPLSFDDLKSAGIQALFTLLDQYNPEANVPFEGFAHLRVRGAMIDESRKMNTMDRKSSAMFNKAQNAYSSFSRTVSLDEMTENPKQKMDFLVDHTIISGEERLIRAENSFELQQALETLSEQERLILTLHFVEGKKMNEIAFILDVSPSHITKTYHSSIQKLRFLFAKKRSSKAKNPRN